MSLRGKTWLNKTLHCSFEALGVTAHEIKGFFPCSLNCGDKIVQLVLYRSVYHYVSKKNSIKTLNIRIVFCCVLSVGTICVCVYMCACRCISVPHACGGKRATSDIHQDSLFFETGSFIDLGFADLVRLADQ